MSLTDKEMRREFDAMFEDSEPSNLEKIVNRTKVTQDMRNLYFDAHGNYGSDTQVYNFYIDLSSNAEGVTNSEKDLINPDHYKVGGIETIDFMKAKSTKEEFCGHLRLTAIKYLSRAGHKDDALQEYKKALWYIEKLVEELS